GLYNNVYRLTIRECFEITFYIIIGSIEIDVHQISQCPAGSIVRWNWRTSRIFEVVGMMLCFEHIQDMRAESLVCAYDKAFGRILLAVMCECFFCLFDADSIS